MKVPMSNLTRRMQKVIAPLSRGEEKRAVKLVSAQLAEQYPPGTKSDYRVFPPIVAIEKPENRETIPERLIRVFVVDYAHKRNLEFILDADLRVVRTEDYRGIQPALLTEELEEADRIARRDRELRRLLKQRGIFLSEFAPEPEPQDGSRMAGLRYVLKKKSGEFEMVARVVVNLSERRVTDVTRTEKG